MLKYLVSILSYLMAALLLAYAMNRDTSGFTMAAFFIAIGTLALPRTRRKLKERREQRKAAKAQLEHDKSITVYVSQTGRAYHYKPTCMGMTGAKAITLAKAKSSGLTPCKVCKPQK